MTSPAISLKDTIKGILFHDLSPGKDGSTPACPTTTLQCELCRYHHYILHSAGHLPLQSDASIMIHTLDEESLLWERLQAAVSSEDFTRDLYGELLKRVVRNHASESCATEQPSVLSGATFHYDRGQNVQRLGRLGPSATSSVFAMAYKPLPKAVVACKSLLLRQEKVAASTSEAEILKTLEHPNVVRFLGYERTQYEALVFMEFIDGGTAEALAETLGGLKELDAALITTQILHGLAYLHGQPAPIIHRNIRGANILITLQGRIKITDLGCARPQVDMNHALTLRTETFFYMSPEMIEDKEYVDARTDIWSLGHVVLELIAGGHPWKHENRGLDVVIDIARYNRMPIPDNISEPLRGLFSRIFQPQESRPTAEALLSDSWIIYLGKPT